MVDPIRADSIALPALDPTVVVDDVHMDFWATPDRAKASKTRRLSAKLMKSKRVRIEALRGISFIARHGESIGIIGRNGSGKSTLAHLISGSLSPTQGSVYASSTPIKLGVNSALVPALSGNQNITLGCLAMGLTPAQIEERYDEILEVSGLGDAVNYPMSTYSSGMSSRLRFAIATSVKPEILIIDEALNTGDAQFKERSTRRMKQMREEAGTVFLVSHSMGTINQVCSRVLWVDYGRLVMDGSPWHVTRAYANFTRYLSDGKTFHAQKQLDLVAANTTETTIEARESGRRRTGK